MDDIEIRRRATAARVARVGTLDERGRVHLVPVVFALQDSRFYSFTDAGPRLAKRLRNLRHDPRVAILIDDYDEDWAKVWWVRLRGTGRVVESGPEWELARRLLREKYPQYATTPAESFGPAMAVDIDHWSGWTYSP